MNSSGGATAVSDHSSPNKPKPNKPKPREVSSRFLSSTSSTATSSSDYGNQSPNSTLISSPNPKPKSSNINPKKHKSYENSGFFRGLWPSSSPSPNSSRPDNKRPDARNPLLLNRQRSCTEFSRFDNEKKTNNLSTKENQKPVFGGSMRYTGKLKSPGKSVRPDDQQIDIITPGRYSVDENTLRKKPSFSGGLSDIDSEYIAGETCFDTPVAGKCFPATYMAPTVSSRKHGIEVPSKFMHDISSSRLRRWSADSGLNQKPVSSLNSNNNNNNSSKIFTLKSPMKKANGLTPGRSGSGNPSTGKGVGNILSLGIGLLKGRKYSSSAASSPLGPGSAENVHQLRLLHNGLMQWRYSNARAEPVNDNIIKKAECNFLFVWNDIMKLHHSVLLKKLQLQKEKMEMKLIYMIQSQIKALENWKNIETEHLSAVCTTIDYLHSVVCRVPLVDGAKVEPQSASVAVRHASDLASSINLMLATFSPTIEKTVGVVGELAKVVTQEKLLLEECFELYRNISVLEIQERSLKSSILQFRLLQHQHQNYLQKSHPRITS